MPFGQRNEILPPPGINPSPDQTELSSMLYVDGDKVRFYDGMPEQIGGWELSLFANGQTISGCARTLFGYQSGTNKYLLIGTNSHLYAYLRGDLFNITPLVAATTALATDPVTTVLGSTTVTIADTMSGGDFADGDRVKLLGATATGGVPAGEINAEHIISNVVSGTSYDITVSTTATSSATGGGASVTRQGQIAAGYCDTSVGVGYGGGKFGVGKYGVPKTFTTIGNEPRIWSFDRFGNNVVMTAGDQTGLYEWTGNTNTAPVLVSNAPTAIEYAFTSDNIVVTLGASGVINRVQWSGQGDNTVWTAAVGNQAGDDDLEGAGEFITHAAVRGVNLLFTRANQVYEMRYIGAPLIWSFRLVSQTQGIIARNARAIYNGVAYWMGTDDFYQYSGGVIQSIPGNSRSGLNTVREYVFKNINRSQQLKCIAGVREEYSEIWWYYPRSANDENSHYVIYNARENHWSIGSQERTGAEYPRQLFDYPFLTDSSGSLYKHEKGVNDDTSAINASLTTNMTNVTGGQSICQLSKFFPDSTQTGNIDVTVTGRLNPQGNDTVSSSFTVTSSTEKQDFRLSCRQRKYTFSNNAVNETFRLGAWSEEFTGGTRR